MIFSLKSSIYFTTLIVVFFQLSSDCEDCLQLPGLTPQCVYYKEKKICTLFASVQTDSIYTPS